MEQKNFYKTMEDGTELALSRWIPDDIDAIKGIVILSHGMAEHSLRYDKVGSILSECGYVFSAHDHRGHGRTAVRASEKGKGMLGYLGEGGIKSVVRDLEEMIKDAKLAFPEKKIILLAHSFGTFVALSLLENSSEHIDGLILSGTSGPMTPIANLGLAFVKFCSLFHKPTDKSRLVRNVIFARFLRKLPKVVNAHEWISLNEANVTMYLNDAWCGGVQTISFYQEMLRAIILVNKRENLARIDRKLPILLASGECDPVGNFGRGVSKLCSILNELSFDSVQMKLYSGDRHEILNELDGEQVLSDMTSWIEKNT